MAEDKIKPSKIGRGLMARLPKITPIKRWPKMTHTVVLPLLTNLRNQSYARAFIAETLKRHKSIWAALDHLEEDDEVLQNTAPLFFEISRAQMYIEKAGKDFADWLLQGTAPEDRQRAARRLSEIFPLRMTPAEPSRKRMRHGETSDNDNETE